MWFPTKLGTIDAPSLPGHFPAIGVFKTAFFYIKTEIRLEQQLAIRHPSMEQQCVPYGGATIQSHAIDVSLSLHCVWFFSCTQGSFTTLCQYATSPATATTVQRQVIDALCRHIKTEKGYGLGPTESKVSLASNGHAHDLYGMAVMLMTFLMVMLMILAVPFFLLRPVMFMTLCVCCC